MESVPGDFMYTSEGDTRVCGFYAIAPEDHLVELTFEDFDIACHDGGLLAVSIFYVSFHSHIDGLI